MNFIKNALKNIAAMFVSLLAGLIIGEIIIRIFFPQVISPVQFYYDSKLGGMVPVPNQKGFKSHPREYYYEYQNNEIGMRDTRNLNDYKKYHYKILAIGDSFTYGWGVNDDETFCKLLEKRINKDSVAVLNAGASGSGTDYALRFFQIRGPELSPKVVLYFYYENDFIDNLENRYFTINQDSIVPKAVNETANLNAIQKNKLANSKMYNWLASHSHLFNMIRTQVGIMWNKKVKKENQNQQAIIQRATSDNQSAPPISAQSTPIVTEQSKVENDQFYPTYVYLKALAKNVEKSGGKFYTFFIPSNKSIIEYQNLGTMSHEKAIIDFCKANNIKVYSFKDVIMKHKDPFKAFYFPTDLHWNKDGNELAADYLYQVLKQELFSPQKK
jgi:lysophospholipase L1-like esterase